MYRRRNNNIPSKINEEKKVENKENQNEPVIKAIYKPRQDAPDYGNSPMLNVLRPTIYFEESSEDIHYVTFNKMVDILFSEGYLNVKKTEWYKDNTKQWSEAFTNTTNYERSTFIPGDIIFTHNEHMSFALLITAIYSSFDDKSPSLYLDYNPPVGGNIIENSEDTMLLQSFNTCNGTVYMFKHNTKFEDIKPYVSTFKTGTEAGKYRKLVPSNLSEATNNEEPSDYTFNRKSNKKDDNDVKPDGYPVKTELPTITTTTPKQFNLKNGIPVEGWLIYFKSTKNSEGTTDEQGPSNIIGDVIASGKIIITKVGEYLSLNGICRIPHIDSTSTTPSGTFYYNGNNIRVVAEPLNSEHYQQNYGDNESETPITVKSSGIYSLSQIIAKA